MDTKELQIIDGKAYIITKQEITAEQLRQIKQRQEDQKAAIEASITEIEAKIVQVEAIEK